MADLQFEHMELLKLVRALAAEQPFTGDAAHPDNQGALAFHAGMLGGYGSRARKLLADLGLA